MSTMQKIFNGFQERQTKLEQSEKPLSHGAALIEGQVSPLYEARIPILDQGFLHSDLTYDVPAVWDGRLFRFDDHLNRLEASCKKLRLKPPMSRDEIKKATIDLIAKSGIRDAYVQLIVTRGFRFVREPVSSDTPDSNFIYVLVMPYVWIMPPQLQQIGGEAIVARTVRRIPPGAIDPTVKNLQWGDLIRGLLEAQDRGSQYPFLTDGDANITEGAGYNIVFVKDGALFTARKGVLEGVTRRTVFDVAEANKIPVHIDDVPTSLAFEADEIFMCTTAGGVMPITKLEGSPVGNGEIGSITKLIWDGYWALHYDPKHTIEIQYDE